MDTLPFFVYGTLREGERNHNRFIAWEGGKLVGPNDIGAQTRQIFQNMRRILEAGGASLRDVVKVTVFVTDIRYRDGYGEARLEFFPANPPASTLVQVAGLAIPGALIEIEAVAVVD